MIDTINTSEIALRADIRHKVMGQLAYLTNCVPTNQFMLDNLCIKWKRTSNTLQLVSKEQAHLTVYKVDAIGYTYSELLWADALQLLLERKISYLTHPNQDVRKLGKFLSQLKEDV